MAPSNSFTDCAEEGGYSERPQPSLPTMNRQRVGTKFRNQSPIPAALKLGQPVLLPQD